VHDLGEVRDFLGCEVIRDRVNHTNKMTCQRKIDEFCEKFGLDGTTRPVASPSSRSFVNSKHPQIEDGEGAGVSLEPVNRCCVLLGSLLYIANANMPNISYIVGVVQIQELSYHSTLAGSPACVKVMGLFWVRVMRPLWDL
jgi:hypothetical protein